MEEFADAVLKMQELVIFHHYLQDTCRNPSQNHLNQRTGIYFSYVRQNDPIVLINDGITDSRFRKMFRLSPSTFQYLLKKVKPFLESRFKSQTNCGRPRIADSTRLGIFLIYMGRDPNYFNVGLIFGISETSVVRIIVEVAYAIKYCYNNKIKPAISYDELHDKATEFNSVSLFENVVGARTPVDINKDLHVLLTRVGMILHNICIDKDDTFVSDLQYSTEDELYQGLCNDLSDANNAFGSIIETDDDYRRAYSLQVRDVYANFIFERNNEVQDQLINNFY